MRILETVGIHLQWGVNMKDLSEYSVSELEHELRIRTRMETNGYVNKIAEAVAELEHHARQNSVTVNFDFGANGLPLSFDPHMNEWEVW